MFSFGFNVILLLIIIGGAVAIIGDYIGRSIGRRHWSLFHLRPRHTAGIFTVITGILIAVTTLGIILTFSQDARTALFGMEKIKKELAETGQQLERSKEEVSALETTRKNLEAKIETARKGEVLFKVGDVLLNSVIVAGPEKDKVEAGLKQILSAADTYVRSLGVKSGEHLIYISPEDFESAAAILTERQGGNVVTVTVTRNIIFGEEVPVKFSVKENKLIYKAGAMIAQAPLPAGLAVPEMEQRIRRLLYITHQSAKQAGVVPDPLGSVGSVPYSDILALEKKIATSKKDLILKTQAKRDTYSIGPLEIDLKFSTQ